jgi:hypothetical protein
MIEQHPNRDLPVFGRKHPERLEIHHDGLIKRDQPPVHEFHAGTGGAHLAR